jgi:hypothetical protein
MNNDIGPYTHVEERILPGVKNCVFVDDMLEVDGWETPYALL